MALGIALLVALTALDTRWTDSTRTSIAAAVIAPFVTALVGSVAATAVVGALAVAAAAASGAWHHNFGADDYVARLLVVAAGGVFAVVGARAHRRLALEQERFRLLQAVAEVAETGATAPDTVARLTDLLVPAWADVCVIDVLSGTEAERLAVRATGPRAAEIERRLRSQARAVDLASARAVVCSPGAVPLARARRGSPPAPAPEALDLLRSLGGRSLLTVPLRARRQGIGAMALVVCERSRRPYGPEELEFAQVLGGRVALALDNAGLFSELESLEARQAAALGGLAEGVIVQDAGGRVVYANAAAGPALGFASADRLLASSPQEIADAFQAFNEDGTALRLEQLPGQRVLSGEQPDPLVVRTVHRDTGEERWRLIKASAVRDAQGSPRLAVNIIEDITEVKRAERSSRLLARVSRALQSSLDYQRTLTRAASLAVPELADGCTVSMPDADGRVRTVAVARRGRPLAFLPDEPPAGDWPDGPAQVIREGRARLVEHPGGAPAPAGDDPDPAPVRSLMVVPMTAGGRTIGALTLTSAESGRVFTRADLELAEELGRRAGTAVENARLHTERSAIASTLSASLLPPRLPDVPGWRLAAMYRPAGAENQVGGDFYDAFETPSGWMVVIGDVAGRGAKAAALTAQARHTVRAAAELLGDPVAALEQLNRTLLRSGGASVCTVAIIVLVEAGESAFARVVCAGHPLPYLVRDGAATAVGHWGPLVGAWEDSAWRAATVGLRDGDTLVLYTDGVTEASGRAERFGEERLAGALARSAGAQDAVARIQVALGGFEIPGQADDTAVLAVQRAAETTLAGPGGGPGEPLRAPARATTIELPGGPSAPGRARRAVGEHLGAALSASRLQDVLVLVSELVTNAVRHGGAAGDRDRIRMTLSAGDGRLRVEVFDRGPGFRRPRLPTARPDGGGNGLVLLHRLASRWDVRRGHDNCVWFEVDLAG